MLFDLRSPRRRNFIRVVYAGLAVLIGGGLILGTFGTGGGGGLLDIFGGDSGGSTTFDPQIEEAEKRVQLDPKNAQAQLSLAKLYFSAGRAEEDVDETTGQATPTADSAEDFQKAADAWAAYLKLDPKKVDSGGANLIAQAYVALAETSTSVDDAVINIQGAADAQKIVAEATPTQGSLSQLAIYLYFTGDTAAADAAAAEAEAKAEPAQKQALKQQLAQFKANAAKFQEQVKVAQKQAKQQQGAPGGAAGGESALSNPLQGAGGGGLGSPGLGQ